MHSREFSNLSYEYTWNSSRLMMHQEVALGAAILYNFFSSQAKGRSCLHSIIQTRLKNKHPKKKDPQEDVMIYDTLPPSPSGTETITEPPLKKMKELVNQVAKLPSKKGLFVVEGEYEENVSAESPGFNLLVNKMFRTALTSSQYTMNQVHRS